MTNLENLTTHIKQAFADLPSDIAVLAHEQFDKNFKLQGFFGQNTWDKSERVKKHGGSTLIIHSEGGLRSSIRHSISGNEIHFTSDVDYASIHNEGFDGTEQVKAHTRRSRKGRRHQVRAHTRHMVMPKRQFIGDHPILEAKIKQLIEDKISQTLQKF